MKTKKSQQQSGGEKVCRFKVGFGRERRASHLSALTLAITDDARREAEMQTWQFSSLL